MLTAIVVVVLIAGAVLVRPMLCTYGKLCPKPAPLDDAGFAALYDIPQPPAQEPLAVYHLGHSLVGKDVPAMLTQLAGTGHSYASQLGWGAFLRQHWAWHVPVNGYEQENTHAEHRDPHEALKSGDYDAVVLTEAVEIRDSILYFSPHYYLRKFATKAWAHNPNARIYLYETWHPLDDPEGWLERLSRDLDLYWEGEILRRALAFGDVTQPIYVIPAGQVMAAFARKVEAIGGLGPIRSRNDLFSDNIHFNDYGAYLVALTHYAVLYRKTPVGLPYALTKADGSPAQDPGPNVAREMQETVWEVVTSYAPTGLPLMKPRLPDVQTK